MAVLPVSDQSVLLADGVRCRVWLRAVMMAGIAQGLSAALLSTAILLWRGRMEGPSAAAMLNASSQWFFGRRALCQRQSDLRHTVAGSLVHHGAAALWGVMFEALRHMPGRRSPLIDGALVGAMAALVDLRLVPKRLGPGFDRHLGRAGLSMVYGGFGLGLVLSHWGWRQLVRLKTSRMRKNFSALPGAGVGTCV